MRLWVCLLLDPSFVLGGACLLYIFVFLIFACVTLARAYSVVQARGILFITIRFSVLYVYSVNVYASHPAVLVPPCHAPFALVCF